MNRNRQDGELSYFTSALRAFLRESHPQIRDDSEFIRQRGEQALMVYVKTVESGNDRFTAMEQANAVLYADLRFSKYDTVFGIVAE